MAKTEKGHGNGVLVAYLVIPIPGKLTNMHQLQPISLNSKLFFQLIRQSITVNLA